MSARIININRFVIRVLFSLLFLFLPHSSLAQIVINEVQLSPTGERFIELYNSGTALDLTGWYIQRKTATGSSFSSSVSSSNFEGKTINANSFFLISRSGMSNSDLIIDSLTLTESNTIQIKNSSGEVVDKLGWGETLDCQNPCPPNPPSGQSIQRVGSDWIVASPTPKAVNQSALGGGQITETSSSPSDSTSSHYSATPITSAPNTKAIYVGAGRDRIGIAGSPIEFGAETGAGNKSRQNIFLWNFGDGYIGGGSTVIHTYEYPGEYIVVLTASLPEGEAISRVNVRIVEPGLSITHADEKRIEITNSSRYEANLFGRALVWKEKTFVFPRDTIIKAGQKISFSSAITGLAPSYVDEADLIVLGEKIEKKHIEAKLDERKQARINEIKNNIALLESQISNLSKNTESNTEVFVSEDKSERIFPEKEDDFSNTNITQTATVLSAEKKGGWLNLLRQFLLKKKDN